MEISHPEAGFVITGIPLRLLLSLILGTIAIASSFADGRDEALSLERKGDYTGAISSYVTWINENPSDESTYDVLLHAASLCETALETLALLQTYVDELPRKDSSRIFARMASLEASYGLPGDAADHYEKAFSLNAEKDYSLYLEAVSLRYSMGEYGRARAGAIIISREVDDESIQAEAAALASMALAASGEEEKALYEISEVVENYRGIGNPMPLFALYEIARMNGNPGLAENASKELESRFPSSVTDYLVSARIMRWNAPSDFGRSSLGRRGSTSVQTGAFHEREGAVSLRIRLEHDGFTAWMEESSGIWRVFVNDSDGRVSDRLAVKGYDVSVGR